MCGSGCRSCEEGRPPTVKVAVDRMLEFMDLSISPGSESFGLFSCVVNGEERDQSHRAVYRYDSHTTCRGKEAGSGAEGR